jgi:hypothetical protein
MVARYTKKKHKQWGKAKNGKSGNAKKNTEKRKWKMENGKNVASM